MRKNYINLLFFAGIALLGSCNKHEIPYEDCAGITSCSLKLPDGKTYACEVSQSALTIGNPLDSIVYGTESSYLKKLTLNLSTTIGAKVFAADAEVVSGVTQLDLSQPTSVTARYNGAQRSYLASVYQEKVDHRKLWGVRVNDNFTQAGAQNTMTAPSVTYFKGKLYMITANYPGGTNATATSYHRLYTSSDNGATWTPVQSSPMKAVGGYGARLAVLGDKLFVFGGIRYGGTDEDGGAMETGWSGPAPKWRALSTTDGVNFTDCTVGQTNAPTMYAFPLVVVHNGAIYVTRGKIFGFGSLQNNTVTTIFKTTDGTNWTKITPTRGLNNDCALYSFNGKLWAQGGATSYLSTSKDNSTDKLYSSSDEGTTWTEETITVPTSETAKRYGHTVVVSNGKLFMLFGETVVANGTAFKTQTVTRILTSTDGSTWSPVGDNYQLPVSCSGRIYPGVVEGDNGLTYIIGGFKTSAGNYAVNGIGMTVLTDVWTKFLK